MKICFVTPTFYPTIGGAENMIFEVASRLVDIDHEVTIISRGFAGMKKVENYNGIQVQRVLTINNPLGIVPLQFSLFNKLGRVIKKYELVHEFYPFHMGLSTVVRKKIAKKPLVLTLVGSDTYDPIKPIPKIFNPYLSWVMNNADAVTAICGELTEHAKAQGSKKRITIIPAGVDLRKFNPNVKGDIIRKDLNIKEGEIMVLSVQRLHPRKKLQCLLKTARMVNQNHSQVKFVIVGEGPERENLIQMAKSLDLENNVIFTGLVPETQLPKYYAACDIFALHSLYEGFGMVLVEAMATGKPVVSTNVGAIPEVVDHGKTGLLVPPLNEMALGENIIRLIEDKELRKKMGRNGLIRTQQKYNWDNIVKEYLDIYKKLVN
ncbi:MAG: glycosyltransferase family 4 protein [Thermoplasmata archaeon]|nr:MAG: glycosyltransferase family 4 protein [Thermoplasmata archaeon]